MPRPARPWFRVYVEMFPDRKIRRLTPAQRWLWVALMGAARESPRPPALYVADGEPMTHAEIADYAGMKEREVGPALDSMRRLGMVEVDDRGVVSLPNFAVRQYESDVSTSRTRAFRERSKERSNDVPGNAPETETEADTEPDPGTTRGENRPVPLRAAPDTDLPDDIDGPGLPAEARCTAHRGIASPPPCAGCKTAREHVEAKVNRADDAIRREHAEAIANCPDCHGGMWVERDGRPVDPPRKCDHRNARRSA